MTQRYSAYKDSGVEWIGDIPEHWEVVRVKYLTAPVNIKSETGEEELLSVSEYFGVIPTRELKDSNEEISRADSLVGYLKVESGQLVSNIMLTWKRGLAVSDFDGIVSPAYSVFEFIGVHPRYYHYLFRTTQYSAEFKRNSKGVIESRLRLYDEMFGSVFSHFPPIPEQTKIVEFLDAKTSLIDRLIAVKERRIELLKEKRTSLINHAVTKGLNPNVKMKDSGIEWIGQIPEHWAVKKLKYGVSNPALKAVPGDGEIKISPENVESDTGVCTNMYSDYEGEGFIFYKGDILFNKLRIYLKKILFAEYDGFSMGEMIVLRCNHGIHNRYLYFLLFNQALIEFLNSQSTGIKMPRVSPEIILNTKIIYPSLSEQQQIVEYLDSETKRIDTLVNLEQKKIDLLKEYRQALISEAVTGKIKVTEDQ